MIKVAMFGAGRIARVHGETLKGHPLVTLEYIVDPLNDVAEFLANELNAKVTDADSVFADKSITAVVICSSTDTHADLIIKAAQSGKAIFCEKPVALDIVRARDAAHIVKDTGVACFIGFNRRFDPTFRTLWEQKEQGRIGDLEQLIITSRDPKPPPLSYIKVSGGLFRDMMIHDLDMARWMLGEDPVEVFATGSCMIDKQIGATGDVDSAQVILKTGSGKLCHISNSRRSVYGYDQRIEILGEKGMLQANNPPQHHVRFSGEEGEISGNPQHFFMERYLSAYRRELEAFITILLEGGDSPITIDDGVKALQLADACYQSQVTGKMVCLV